jgi:hypothetical protein
VLAITVQQPASNTVVTSPFNVTANTTTCNGVPAVSMGYEIDNGTTIYEGDSFSALVSASKGPHTLKIKCWGKGTTEQQKLNITVASSSAPIPPGANSVSQIQTLPGWRTKYDPGTNGSATGSRTMVTSPTLSGQTAQHVTSYNDYGGVLYSVDYGSSTSAHNFVYDAEVQIASGSTLGNLEMDNNQVTSNGDTIIYAFQCAGASGYWEYSRNSGTPASPVVQWVKSSQKCNPMNWSTNTWHHIQIWTSRDDKGDVTYHSVYLDGVEYPINATVMSDFQLGWKVGVEVANFQVDGLLNSGVSTLYLDQFTMYSW